VICDEKGKLVASAQKHILLRPQATEKAIPSFERLCRRAKKQLKNNCFSRAEA
jgi:hypothetical protein